MLFYGYVNLAAETSRSGVRCWSRMILRRPLQLLSEIASLGFEWVSNVEIHGLATAVPCQLCHEKQCHKDAGKLYKHTYLGYSATSCFKKQVKQELLEIEMKVVTEIEMHDKM